MSDETTQTSKPKKNLKTEVYENVKTIIIALVIALVIRSFFFGNYKIPTPSMVPTLLVGDHLFVSKLSYSMKLPVPLTNINLWTYDTPKRGDVIVFQSVQDKDIDFIKRVIGLPGDTIELKDQIVYVNGKALETTVKEAYDGKDYDYPFVEKYTEVINGHPHTIQQYSVEQLKQKAIEDPLYRSLLIHVMTAGNFGPYTVPVGHYFMMGDNRHNSSDSREWGPVPFENVRGKAKIIWLSWDKEESDVIGQPRFNRFFNIIR